MSESPIHINLKWRAQLLAGFLISLWLYLFLVLVGPYDGADVDFVDRISMMSGYGFSAFVSYAMISLLERKLYEVSLKWNLSNELKISLAFYALTLPISFAYYKTEIVQGEYSFGIFTGTLFLPTVLIMTPIVFLVRYLVARKMVNTKSKIFASITLKGDNKLDILNVEENALVCIQAASNYVTVYYLQNERLRKKLLRTSLSKIYESVPRMTQVHRSYLINLDHFSEWEDGLTLAVNELSIPVSKKYKPAVLEQLSFVTD
ncbi:MAG: LytTR family DNA-binding domain-containing protein [Bacteroidota bacterium]